MTTSFNREEIKQMLDDSGIDYSLNSDTPGIVYKDGTYQTFDQALESFSSGASAKSLTVGNQSKKRS